MTNNNTETASHAGHCLVIEIELYTKYMGARQEW